jgi:hypothetical protein
VKQLFSMVERIFATHADEIDCEGCDAEMAHFVELMNAGQDPARLLPLVQEHLDRCGDCREEFEALLAIIRAEKNGLLGSDER